MRSIQYERIARAIVEAQIYGDSFVIKKHSITRSTLDRWRNHATRCDKLRGIVETLIVQSRESWFQQNADAGLAWIEFFRKSAEAMNPADPESVKVAVAAYRAVGEMAVAAKITSDTDRSVCGEAAEAVESSDESPEPSQ